MSEMWENPLIPIEDRLEIAAGTIEFERKVSANQRKQKEQLSAELTTRTSELQSMSEEKAALQAMVKTFHKTLTDIAYEGPDANAFDLMNWALDVIQKSKDDLSKVCGDRGIHRRMGYIQRR